ncbi:MULTISPECIES: VWA domain-containing protein [unclassified Bacillus (in: firmicutes)]|uniref:VWA domain-containing protein n=1 Tax=unclassified Bacillus (in: firmicutes) TaxID=185979 RepID=UPI0025B35F42|nr:MULTISPECIES: VWA domain-containing protein [unclassified Bacillus (in: firmicutes)]MDN0191189.1 VWA domain-containing protein [Bacillus sp. B.PNR1]MDN3032095.1 VWA domain-containing protein [Bacillus sp. B.PNR2]
MDKLEEVKKFDITIFTSWLKRYAECGQGLEKAWHFLIEQAELAEKRQEIIEENKRQQEVTVHQFRQAQEELQRLNKENDRFRKAFHQFANMKTVRTAPELVIQMYSRYAQELLEGRGMEGDAE